MDIFDHFYNEFLRDTSNSYVKTMQRAAQLTGEEYLFGIDEGQIEAFLTQCGFRDVRNATGADLERLYFSGPNAGRKLPTRVAFVSARVIKGIQCYDQN